MFRAQNIDSILNQLHRVITNSGVKMHLAQHEETLPTGENPAKGPLVKTGDPTSSKGSSFGTLKEPK